MINSTLFVFNREGEEKEIQIPCIESKEDLRQLAKELNIAEDWSDAHDAGVGFKIHKGVGWKFKHRKPVPQYRQNNGRRFLAETGMLIFQSTAPLESHPVAWVRLDLLFGIASM